MRTLHLRFAALALLVSFVVARPLLAGAPDPKQKAVVDLFAQHVIAIEAVYNETGKVTKLAISNHNGTARGKAGNLSAPGVTPEIFKRILELPDLEAIAIEKQPIGDESYKLLGQLKKLRDVRLQYLDAKAGATGDAPLFINELPLPLEVLELKHCFSIKDGCMEKLKPQPELRKLEIDTTFAAPEAVPFILNSPKIENLQIHRTTMSDADLQKIFAALPKLQVLEIRPTNQKGQKDRITGASLRGLKNNPELVLFSINMQWETMPFEGGLDAFVGLKKLRQVALGGTDVPGLSIDSPEVQQLHKARPDVKISVGGGKSLGGTEAPLPVSKDDGEWNWDKGVNTHG